MKEYRDACGRLTVHLSDDVADLMSFMTRLRDRYPAAPTKELSGLDQTYCDSEVDGVVIVLHSDTLAGISLHVEDGTQEDLLRSVAEAIETDAEESAEQAAAGDGARRRA